MVNVPSSNSESYHMRYFAKTPVTLRVNIPSEDFQLLEYNAM
jgi:hypothetical protein